MAVIPATTADPVAAAALARTPAAGVPPGPDDAQRRHTAARRWRWGLFVVGWLLLGLLFVGTIVTQSLADRTAIPWSKVISELCGWYLWGLLFPPIYRLTRRFPIFPSSPGEAARPARQWLTAIAVSLVSGLIASAVYVVLVLAKNELVTVAFTGKRFDPNVFKLLPSFLMSGIEFYLLVYFLIVVAIHAMSFQEQYQERELKASRLEAQLALAKLQVLRMQLHPHFLFNTLNAISALMHRDVDAADRMIALLSDLLRLSLDKDDRHQVPLQSELEFLERYLAIEKIRFRDRLKVDVDVDDECFDAQVPKLILQPLVENSIKHGVAMRSAAGRVAIRARRRGDRLALAISDDGPGLPVGRPPHEGVGLANTRARLAQMYGSDHRLELDNQPSGGLLVRLEVPFERQRRFGLEGAA